MKEINRFIGFYFLRLEIDESAVLFDDAVGNLYFVVGYRQYFPVVGQSFHAQVATGADKVPTVVPLHSQLPIALYEYGVDEGLCRREVGGGEGCRFLSFGEGFAANVVEVLQGFGADVAGDACEGFGAGEFYFREANVLHIVVAAAVVVFHAGFFVGLRLVGALLYQVGVGFAVSAQVAGQVRSDKFVGGAEAGFGIYIVPPTGKYRRADAAGLEQYQFRCVVGGVGIGFVVAVAGEDVGAVVVVGVVESDARRVRIRFAAGRVWLRSGL